MFKSNKPVETKHLSMFLFTLTCVTPGLNFRPVPPWLKRWFLTFAWPSTLSLQTVERRRALPCPVLLWMLRLIPDQPPAAVPAPLCPPCLQSTPAALARLRSPPQRVSARLLLWFQLEVSTRSNRPITKSVKKKNSHLFSSKKCIQRSQTLTTNIYMPTKGYKTASQLDSFTRFSLFYILWQKFFSLNKRCTV